MRAELANLDDCAVPFLSRAAVNLCWYYYILYSFHQNYTVKNDSPLKDIKVQ